jgi:hypothetical protein
VVAIDSVEGSGFNGFDRLVWQHYKDMGLAGRTSVLEGFRVGYGRIGDRLDVTHFVVDGKDIRDFFNPVFQVYYDYFHTSDNSLDKLVK